MKAILFSLISVFLCAVANVITQKKLGGVSPAASVAIIPLIHMALVIPLVFIIKHSGATLAFPKGNEWLFVSSVGILYFFANLCFFNAYKNDIAIIAATTMAMLLPVFASIIKFAIDKHFPTATQLVGFLLAAAAVYLVSK